VTHHDRDGTVAAVHTGQPREAVARLRSARQRLYVSVKTVEFFGKLGIRSRKDLIARISAPHPQPET